MVFVVMMKRPAVPKDTYVTWLEASYVYHLMNIYVFL